MTLRAPRHSLPDEAVNQLLAHNQWVTFAPERDGFINWRHVVAMRLRDVEIAPFVPTVKRLLPEMAEMTNLRVLDEWLPIDGEQSVMQFTDWLSRWLDHFSPKGDTIRTLFQPLCMIAGGDALQVPEFLDIANGVVWCDYVLDVVDQFQSHWGTTTWTAREEVHLREPLFKRGPGQEGCRAFTLFAIAQYEKFRAMVTFKAAPAPTNSDLWINFDNLFDCSMWEARDDAA